MALQVFPIAAPTRSRWSWIFLLVALVALLPALLVLAMAWSDGARFEVSKDGLKVRGSLYGRTISTAAIRLDGCRRLTVDDTPALYPKLRTNGIGLPNYAAGWFELNDGRKALMFVTDWSRTILVPTTSGFDLVLSPEYPDEFVAALKAMPAASSEPRKFSMATQPTQERSGFDVINWLVCILVPLVLAITLIPLLLSGRNVRFELSDRAVRIRGDLYGRTVPKSELQINEVSIIDINGHPTFGRMLRTNGIGLPNYLSGWFRPKGGGRALLFVSDKSRVVRVPTTAGYQLLISPADPDAFVTELCRGVVEPGTEESKGGKAS